MPDWAFIRGKVRPIRHTPGYAEEFVGLSQREKDSLRKMSSEDGNTYAHTADRQGRARRAEAARSRPRLSGRLAQSVQEASAARLDAPRHHPKIW